MGMHPISPVPCPAPSLGVVCTVKGITDPHVVQCNRDPCTSPYDLWLITLHGTGTRNDGFIFHSRPRGLGPPWLQVLRPQS